MTKIGVFMALACLQLICQQICAQTAVCPDSIVAWVDRGQILFDNEDYKSAYEWYMKAAEHGDSFAEFAIGAFYMSGLYVVQDYSKAFYWYNKAALQGEANAYCDLGLLYYNGWGVKQDYSEAFKWYLKSANTLNEAEAQKQIGILYHQGWGVQKNYKESFNWTQKAAIQGLADAQHNLGVLYYEWQQDYAQAFYWCLKAAKQGFKLAQLSVAEMYEKGVGVKKDLAEAAYWKTLSNAH